MAVLSQEEQHALIEAHMTYAEKGAAAWCRRLGGKVEMDVLRSAAYFGLVHAAAKFDPSKGFAFTTYSFHWIERFMYGDVYLRERRANGWSYEANKAEKAQGLKGAQRVALRVEFPQYLNKDGEVVDIDIANGEPNPETLLLYKEHCAQQAQAIVDRNAELFARATTERERAIVQLWIDGKSLREAGASLGISGARVQQIASDMALPSFRYKPATDDQPVSESPGVLVGTLMPRAIARVEIERLLTDVPIGDVIGYEAIAGAVGRTVFEVRGTLSDVRRRLLDDHGIVFGSVCRVGLRRLSDADVLGVAARTVKGAASAAKRGIRVLSAVRDFDGLTNEQQLHHNVMSAQLGMLAHVTSEDVTKRVEARMIQAPTQMLGAALIDAMKDSL